MRPNLRQGGVWTDVAVVSIVVAAGIAVAGATNSPQSDYVAIPGCDEVVQRDEQERVNFAFTGGDFGGGLDVPWATRAGADAMTAALAAALPPGAVVESDHFGSELEFNALAFGADGSSFGEDATAFGTVTADGRTGVLTVNVRRAFEPLGPCFAGYVDERSTREDGTVVDTHERDGSLRVAVRAPDGTRVDVFVEDVLTLDQAVSIASTPGLRVDVPA